MALWIAARDRVTDGVRSIGRHVHSTADHRRARLDAGSDDRTGRADRYAAGQERCQYR